MQNISNQPPISDRTVWYSDLSYFPSEYKDSRLWMAQMLFWAQSNSVTLVDPVKARIYRDMDRLGVDSEELKKMIDPPTTKDRKGGHEKRAQYFSSDWKANPIGRHLDNILEGRIRSLPIDLTVSVADPIAKLLDQKEKEKIIIQNWVRNIINELMKELGKPGIRKNEDPYRWIQNFSGSKNKGKMDTLGDAIDQIKTKLSDDDSLRLFQNILYKNGIELAFEVGIKYFLLDQNEFDTKYAPFFFRDLKNFNTVTGRYAIDELTGMGTVRYIDPSELRTSPFRDINGDDILYWYYEEDLSFADFERLVGSDMTPQEKAQVLQLQKQQGWDKNMMGTVESNIKNTAFIRVGFFSVCSQESKVFSEKYLNNELPLWDNRPLTWQPDPKTGENLKTKTYNVWHSCYYIPQMIFNKRNSGVLDWAEQSKYIFHIRKDFDMMRYGADRRYAKSSLVIWNDRLHESWADVTQAFMPKINLVWQKFQNCLIADVQGMALDEDLLGAMLNAVDEANTAQPGGGDKIIEEWKQLKQAGIAFMKFRNKNGQMIVVDPAKLFINIDSGHMKKAEMYFAQMMNLYNMMTQALASTQADEGQTVKPRTPLGAVQLATKAAGDAKFFIEQAYSDGVLVQFGMRAAQHIHAICKEKATFNQNKRWDILNDVIGRYNGATLESIEKINFENIGMTITNEDDNQKRELVIQAITQRFNSGMMSARTWGLALNTKNWKLQVMEMFLEEQRKEALEQQKAQMAFNQQMQLKDKDLQTAALLAKAKGSAKDQNIQTQGAVDAQLDNNIKQLKDDSMAKQKQQLLQNRLTENQQKAELEKSDAREKQNLDEQKSLANV